VPVLKKYSRILSIACFVLAAASSAHGRLPDLQLMANHMAEAVSASREPSVVVIDFHGPGEHFTRLGASLADSFNNDLKNTTIRAALQEREPMRD
jgi:hypothetical protein